MRHGITRKNSVSTLFLRRKIFIRQGIPLAHFLCDRVQYTLPSLALSSIPPGMNCGFLENYFMSSRKLRYYNGSNAPFILASKANSN